MKNTFFFLLGVGFLVGCVYLFLSQPASPRFQEDVTHPREVTMRINDFQITAEVADTDRTRIQGLSGRKSLEEGRGMLFVFDTSAKHGIWMKSMSFPIDIVWLNEEKRVVHVERGVSPDTYPEIFYPQSDSRYIIELPEGSVEENSIDTGSIVSW